MRDQETHSSPLVSVVIPAFNSERFLKDAIDSVLNQSYTNKELIVVDDGSSDGTVDLVKSYGDSVRLICQENSGPGAARNRGVDASSGTYIAFLDSDDFWLPGKLAAQVSFLEQRPDCALLYHDWIDVDSNSDEDRRLRSEIHRQQPSEVAPLDTEACETGWLYNELLSDSIMTTISVMMRRTLFQSLGGFDDSLPQGQDYDMWLRASRETPIARLGCTLAVVSRRSGSITTSWRPTNYRVLVLEKALHQWGTVGPDGRVTPKREINQTLANLWFGFAYHHANGGNHWVALRSFIKVITLRPLRLKAWLHIFRLLVLSLDLTRR